MDNTDWSLASIYPQHVVVPQSVGLSSVVEDVVLQNICQRFPAVSYRHTITGAVLARSTSTSSLSVNTTSVSSHGHGTSKASDNVVSGAASSLPAVSGLSGHRSIEFMLVALAECPSYVDTDSEYVLMCSIIWI